MSDYDVVIGILGFLIISHLGLIELGGGEHFFQDVNLTEEQLTFQPENPRQAQFFDLSYNDRFDSENLTVVDTDTLNNTEFDTPSTIVLEQGESSGYISFNIPEAQTVRFKTQKDSVFITPRTQFTSDTRTDDIPLRGVSEINLNSDTNVVTVNFEDPTGILNQKEPRLYDVQASEVQPTDDGFFGLNSLIDTIYSIASTPIRFYNALAQFPFYIKVFYGGLIVWLIADILQIG